MGIEGCAVLNHSELNAPPLGKWDRTVEKQYQDNSRGTSDDVGSCVRSKGSVRVSQPGTSCERMWNSRRWCRRKKEVGIVDVLLWGSKFIR